MVQVVGFPQKAKRTIEPGQIVVSEIDGATVFCLQGVHYRYALVGHGRPPCRAWWAFDGPDVGLPGEVQLRPLRDRPWSMAWRASPSPGDLVISDQGAFLCVEEPDRDTLTTAALIDPRTANAAPGAITGPVFRGWELVWFPLPNRPMVLGAYDPAAAGRLSAHASHAS